MDVQRKLKKNLSLEYLGSIALDTATKAASLT